jgi:hypothetical protein
MFAAGRNLKPELELWSDLLQSILDAHDPLDVVAEADAAVPAASAALLPSLAWRSLSFVCAMMR